MADVIASAAPVAAPAASPAPAAPEASETQNLEVKEDGQVDSKSVESKDGKPLTEKEIKDAAKELGMSAKELKKVLEIKVDGKMVKEEIDFNDEEGLKKKLQLAAVGQKRMAESAQLRKDVEKFFDFMQKNPEEAMRQLGHDPDKMAQAYLDRKIEDLKKSPEQLEKEKMQKEIEAYKKQLQDKEDSDREIQKEQMKDKFANEINQDITAALDNTKDIPKSPYVVKRVADAMIQAIKLGYHDVTAKDVLPIVTKQIKSEIQALINVMPEEMMEAFIGKANFDRHRKKRISGQKPPEPISNIKATGTLPKETEKQKVNMKEFFKNLK